MKKFFRFLVSVYDAMFHRIICNKFQQATQLFPELNEGIEILQIGFGRGIGSFDTMCVEKVRTNFVYRADEPMYFARVKTKSGEIGYLYVLKENMYFVSLFKRENIEEEINFFFNIEGIITKDGKKIIPFV